ncbi:MAG TPA: NUDIX hydrolase [Candidatus Binatia bacterium]
MRTVKEISSGGVIYRVREGTTEVVLIRVGGRWCLPKGQVERGEKLKDTALREVREETGLEGQIVASIGDIAYWFTGKNKENEAIRISKRVHFYLMRCLGGDVSHHDHEVEEARWFAIAEATGWLSHQTEKEMIVRAATFLKNQPNRRRKLEGGGTV